MTKKQKRNRARLKRRQRALYLGFFERFRKTLLQDPEQFIYPVSAPAIIKYDYMDLI